MQHPYVVSTQVQHLGRWSDTRWNSLFISERKLESNQRRPQGSSGRTICLLSSLVLLFYLLMHSVVSLPDFHMHTHWSGQSEIVLRIIHDVKISIKNRQCSSFLTDIFKCLFHPDSSHFWAPSLVRTWKKGHIVDQLWYRGQQKKVMVFYKLESFRKHRHLLVPFQGFHQKWCYFFFFWATELRPFFILWLCFTLKLK